MSSLFEGRGSDSPYIEAVWRGRAGSDYAPVCPASGHWHLLFLRQNGRVKVSIEGHFVSRRENILRAGRLVLAIS